MNRKLNVYWDISIDVWSDDIFITWQNCTLKRYFWSPHTSINIQNTNNWYYVSNVVYCRAFLRIKLFTGAAGEGAQAKQTSKKGHNTQTHGKLVKTQTHWKLIKTQTQKQTHGKLVTNNTEILELELCKKWPKKVYVSEVVGRM